MKRCLSIPAPRSIRPIARQNWQAALYEIVTSTRVRGGGDTSSRGEEHPRQHVGSSDAPQDLEGAPTATSN